MGLRRTSIVVAASKVNKVWAVSRDLETLALRSDAARSEMIGIAQLADVQLFPSEWKRGDGQSVLILVEYPGRA